MQYRQPLELANSCKKSEAYFRAQRWGGKRYCPGCGYRRKLYSLSDGRFQCARCSFKFREFTGTYLENLRIGFDELSHLLYLFVLGVPSYRCRGLSVCISKDRSEALYSLSSGDLRPLHDTTQTDHA